MVMLISQLSACVFTSRDVSDLRICIRLEKKERITSVTCMLAVPVNVRDLMSIFFFQFLPACHFRCLTLIVIPRPRQLPVVSAVAVIFKTALQASFLVCCAPAGHRRQPPSSASLPLRTLKCEESLALLSLKSNLRLRCEAQSCLKPS